MLEASLQKRPPDFTLDVAFTTAKELAVLTSHCWHSTATHDLEITVPNAVYHRVGLDTEKHIIVELGRQAVHVMPHQSDAGTDASSPALCASHVGYH